MEYSTPIWRKRSEKEHYRRIRLVTNSELNAANRIDGMNTYAVPVVTYSFNIIDWIEQDLQRIDRKTRKIMAAERMHHPKADRLNVCEQIRRRTRSNTTGNSIQADNDRIKHLPHLQWRPTPENSDYSWKTKKKYSVVKQAVQYKRELQLPESERTEGGTKTMYAK